MSKHKSGDPEVAARLKAARERAGYRTAADAAREMKLSYQTYAGHENQSAGIRLRMAQRYSEFFGVSLDWLLTGSNKPRIPRIAPNEQTVGRLLAGCAGIDFDTAPRATQEIVATLVVSAIRVLKKHSGAA